MSSDCTYVEYRDELVRLADEDQHEIMTQLQAISEVVSPESRKQKEHELHANCHRRAERMLVILREIKEPTITNIGSVGCEAVLLLAQHSYLSIMKEVLAIFQKLENTSPKNISKTYIPSLIDRILILEKKPQEFGTQWMTDAGGTPFLLPTRDFETVNIRRKNYQLGPIKKPVNLAKHAKKYPLGKGRAVKEDQKTLTEEAYSRYAYGYINPF